MSNPQSLERRITGVVLGDPETAAVNKQDHHWSQAAEQDQARVSNANLYLAEKAQKHITHTHYIYIYTHMHTHARTRTHKLTHTHTPCESLSWMRKDTEDTAA